MGDIRSLFQVAARQHGAFSIRQARAAGFDRFAVDRRLRSGVWIRLHDSVCAFASSPATWERIVWAAVLSRDRALVTHWTACRLFGVTDVPNGGPFIIVPRGSNTRSAVGRFYETDQFDRIASTSIAGLPVTTMPETMLVLARDTDRATLTRVFDDCVITGRLDLAAMARTIDREAGRRTPGTPLLRELTSSRLPTAPSQSSTYLEALVEVMMGDPRVPAWTREYEFSLDGVPSRVDVYIPSVRLVIEADGRNWHTKWMNFESDRARDNALAAKGIQVLRFTYEMLTTEPHKCLEQTIATCLIRAA